MLGVADGLAQLDVDGSGNTAGANQLAQLGITDAERAQLAQLYPPGKTLWRVAASHFTPWDCNWPYGPPDDSEPPPPVDPETGDEDQPDSEDSDECEGCSIEAQSQTLGEEIPITGTPLSLHYRSDRVPGHKTNRTLEIPLSDATVPASLKRIDLKIEVAGHRFEQSFPSAPNQRYTFDWDGKDVYGRVLHGHQTANVELGYVYGVVYRTPAMFATAGRAFAAASAGGARVGAVRGSQDFIFWKAWETTVRAFAARQAGLSGWSLGVHHA